MLDFFQFYRVNPSHCGREVDCRFKRRAKGHAEHKGDSVFNRSDSGLHLLVHDLSIELIAFRENNAGVQRGYLHSSINR